MQRHTRPVVQCSIRASKIDQTPNPPGKPQQPTGPQRRLGASRACLARQAPCTLAQPAAPRRLTLTTVLIVTADHPPTQATTSAPVALVDAMQAAGHPVLGAVPCHMLVREVIRLAPQVVVAWLGGGPGGTAGLPPALAAALALLAAAAPRPVLVAGAAALPGDVDSLLALHLQAWLPGPPDALALQAAIGLALPRFGREQALQLTLQGAQARLDERKWVDRAKGLLMRGQQLSEDDAFSLLRAASMQANLRVGEVSRSLIETPRAADAINRAGQLRMLSQHCVKALALRAGSAPGRVRADDGLEQTLQRMQDNLGHLASLQPDGLVANRLVGTLAAPQALTQLARDASAAPTRAGAAARPWAPVLQQADALAEVSAACRCCWGKHRAGSLPIPRQCPAGFVVRYLTLAIIVVRGTATRLLVGHNAGPQNQMPTRCSSQPSLQ